MPISRRLASTALAIALVLSMLVALPSSGAETRSISGTVTWPSTLASKWKSRIQVTAIWTTASGGTDVVTTMANATTGKYEIRGLEPRVYHVHFRSLGYTDADGVYEAGPLVSEYYDGVRAGNSALFTPVDLTHANATGIDASLDMGASIQGKVTVPSGTAADWWKGVFITAYDGQGRVDEVNVRRDGTYSINGVPPGTYRLQAHIRAYWPAGATTAVTPRLLGEYWKESRTPEKATPVKVGASNKTGINFTLEKSFTASGTVSLPAWADKDLLKSVYVYFTDSTGWSRGASINPATGAWTVTDLYAGSYTVRFGVNDMYRDSPSGPWKYSDVLAEYYNNKPNAETATKVSITTANKTGINATLDVGGGISGKVTLPAGVPSEWAHGFNVFAVKADGTRHTARVDRETGEYRITRLVPGDYTVHFSVAASASVGGGPSFSPLLASEYFNNVYLESQATPVTVTAGATTTGINAALERAISVENGPRIVWYDDKNGLQARPGDWTPAPTAFAYQWFRDGVEIPGVTSDIIMLSDSDRGKKFKVRVSGQAPGYGLTVKEHTVSVPLLDFASTPIPTITGTARSGYTLTAKPGTWTPAATFKYQWFRNGTKISGATKSTYKVLTSDRGKKISVKVTASRTGHTTVSKTSAAKLILKEFATTPTPKITGTLKAGKTLTAVRGTWKPTPTSYSYQWYRNGKKISGATKKTYKLTKADKGKVIKVKVTAKKSGYASTTKTSKGKTVAK